MLRTALRFLTAHALASLAEPRCCACDAPVPVETVFCGPCAATLVEVEGDDGARSVAVAAFAYGGALRDAIVRFKYGGRDDLARPLGALLARVRGPVARARPGVIVPVPSHASRLASRCYEPSALLGRALATAVGA
ncbi:MAG TPA: ComF family protein, partial [Polyangiaceae bacterium]|nr:ComF family protein [Polyangiaceae bacterium]